MTIITFVTIVKKVIMEKIAELTNVFGIFVGLKTPEGVFVF